MQEGHGSNRDIALCKRNAFGGPLDALKAMLRKPEMLWGTTKI